MPLRRPAPSVASAQAPQAEHCRECSENWILLNLRSHVRHAELHMTRRTDRGPHQAPPQPMISPSKAYPRSEYDCPYRLPSKLLPAIPASAACARTGRQRGCHGGVCRSSRAWPPVEAKPLDSESCRCLKRPESRRLNVFWHITLLPNLEWRARDVLGRQFALLRDSGLLDHAQVHVGLVRLDNYTVPVLDAILRHPNVRVAAEVTQGFECTTTGPLWQFARAVDKCCRREQCCGTRVRPVLYMHSRAMHRLPGKPDFEPATSWTQMLEYFNIEHWRAAVNTIELNGAVTAGCEMFPHRPRWRNRTSTFHYSGNFWWAAVPYLARLPDPVSWAARAPPKAYRYECGEDWLLLNRDPQHPEAHAELHVTRHSDIAWTEGRVHSYKQSYARAMYDCPYAVPSAQVPLIPSTGPCERSSRIKCHTAQCRGILIAGGNDQITAAAGVSAKALHKRSETAERLRGQPRGQAKQ